MNKKGINNFFIVLFYYKMKKEKKVAAMIRKNTYLKTKTNSQNGNLLIRLTSIRMIC